MSNNPYIIKHIEVLSYNPEYGDNRICECGHTYDRHFDSYEDMEPIGCKYCGCYEFVENTGKSEELVEKILQELNTVSTGWSLSSKFTSEFMRFSNEDNSIFMDYSNYNEQELYMFKHLRIIIKDSSSLEGYSTESITAAYNDLKETVQKYNSEIAEYLSKL
jgi:hypothetical protein